MKVFISHSANDAKLAKRLAIGLRAAGLQAWDEDQILPGDNWAAAIGKALEEANAIVVLLTPSSIHSKNLILEIGYALGKQELKGRLIPVIAVPTEQLDPNDIPWVFTLSQFQTIHAPNLERDEAELNQITQTLLAFA